MGMAVTTTKLTRAKMYKILQMVIVATESRWRAEVYRIEMMKIEIKKIDSNKMAPSVKASSSLDRTRIKRKKTIESLSRISGYKKTSCRSRARPSKRNGGVSQVKGASHTECFRSRMS